MRVFVSSYVSMHVGAPGSPKRGFYPLELEFTGVCELVKWVLGSKLLSSIRTRSVLNH